MAEAQASCPDPASLPDSIMVSDYPKPDPAAIDAAADAEMNLVQDIITQVRNYRAEEKIPAGQQIDRRTARLRHQPQCRSASPHTARSEPARLDALTATVEVHKQEPTLDDPSEQVQTAATASLYAAISSEASAIKSLAESQTSRSWKLESPPGPDAPRLLAGSSADPRL